MDDRRLSILLVLLMMTRGAWLLFPFDWGTNPPPRNTVLEAITPLWVWGSACLVSSALGIATLWQTEVAAWFLLFAMANSYVYLRVKKTS